MDSALAALLPTTATLAWLLSASVKAALLLAASWLGAVLLRRGTPAARHQLWALGVAGALLLPLLGWALPSLLSLSPSLRSLLSPPLTGDGRSLLAAAVFVTGDRAASVGPAWPMWLAILWAAGALLVSLRFVRGHLAARRLSRAAAPAHTEAWWLALHEAAASLAIAPAVGLCRSEAIRSPMTIGVLRPRVLLPAAADGWSPQRLRAVLLHELGHVRRRDTLIQLGAQLACTLYWWNPLAWLAAARLRIEREHACDDLVIGAGIPPSSYATDLLEVARSISSDRAAHTGAVCMADLSWTEARLHRILDSVAPRRPLGARSRWAARGATLALAVTLACTSARPALPTPSDPPPAATAEATARAAMAKHGHASRGNLTLEPPYLDPDRGAGDFQPPGLTPEDARDLSLVAAEVQRHLDDLRQCYERRLVVDPWLTGKVIVHWNIKPTGEVSEQCITEDTIGDAEIIACVNRLGAQARFPASRGGPVDVSFPFVFGATL